MARMKYFKIAHCLTSGLTAALRRFLLLLLFSLLLLFQLSPVLTLLSLSLFDYANVADSIHSIECSFPASKFLSLIIFTLCFVFPFFLLVSFSFSALDLKKFALEFVAGVCECLFAFFSLSVLFIFTIDRMCCCLLSQWFLDVSFKSICLAFLLFYPL